MNKTSRLSRSTPLFLATILFSLGLCLGGAEAAAKSATELRLGSDVWPPFTDAPGKLRAALDLVHAALERAKFESRTTLIDDFADLIREIREGDQFDGSAALWRTPEREQFLLFSRPYLENRLVLLARKGTDVSAESLAALVDKRVGLVDGYEYGAVVTDAPGPVLVRGPSDQANFQSLLRGELDYILVDELLVHDLFERYGDRAEVLLAAGTTSIVERPLHMAVRRDHPQAGAIIDRFNDEIGKMIADGSYNRILGLTWVRADLDGDGKSELVLGGVQAGNAPPESGYPVPTSGAQVDESASESTYVIGGNTYKDWNQIPERYKVPVDRNYEGPEPGLVLFEF